MHHPRVVVQGPKQIGALRGRIPSGSAARRRCAASSGAAAVRIRARPFPGSSSLGTRPRYSSGRSRLTIFRIAASRVRKTGKILSENFLRPFLDDLVRQIRPFAAQPGHHHFQGRHFLDDLVWLAGFARREMDVIT